MNPRLRAAIVLVLVLAGTGFAVLTIGAFGQDNPDVPGVVTLVKNIEGSLSRALGFRPGTGAQDYFFRGFAYLGLTFVCSAIAALLAATPRLDSIPQPGVPGAPAGATPTPPPAPVQKEA
ncbi:MAG TPA: hypothetical protein VHN99_10485 [Deinococcales bacterium]|nr:hypothetical protein [Deinococcales bacterium]